MKDARIRADEAWKKNLRFGPVAIDARTAAILNQEHRSVQTVYNVALRMALEKESDFFREDGTSHGIRIIEKRPGGRRWNQEVFAIACQLSRRIAVKALKRLQALGLIHLEITRGRGASTYIFIENFEVIRTRLVRGGIGVTRRSSASPSDAFISPTTSSRSKDDLVDVPGPQSRGRKEGGTLEKPKAPEFVKRFNSTGEVDIPEHLR